MRQIRGFDINESALRFAALGLYLISIELDGNPAPVQKLKFENLRGSVLQKYKSAYKKRSENDREADMDCTGLGSLQECALDHINQYDIVIGNPPWATSTGLKGWKWLRGKIDAITSTRLQQHGVTVAIPNEVLDLPFVWRAMEWAKKDGQIIFALHARILFQQGENMPSARSSLFQALDVTGIINGAELRNTNVWPEITAPFCLLFAKNRVPTPTSGFRFVSPRLESRLNRAGVWRLDVSNSEIILAEEVRREPTILKTLYRGTRLDAEILQNLFKRGWPTVREYWKNTFGVDNGQVLGTGNGYQRIRSSSKIRKNGDGFPGVSATYLRGKPELNAAASRSLVIKDEDTRLFSQIRIHDPRAVEIFKAPLLVVPESPPVRMGRVAVSVSFSDLIYNQSYHGYSTCNHYDSNLLVKYLSLVFSSRLMIWHALMTSGRFGFEREVIEKFTLDSMVLCPLDFSSKVVAQEISNLFQIVASDNSDAAWKQVDEWIYKIYSVTERDIRIIEDTLHYSLPYAWSREKAQMPVQQSEKVAFCQALKGELDLWASEYGGEKVGVTPLIDHPLSPWLFVEIGTSMGGNQTINRNALVSVALQAANSSGATEIRIIDEVQKSIFLGRINEARYWTFSQALLCAKSIMWDHVDLILEGNA